MIHKSFNDTELIQGPTNNTFEYNIADKDINYCISEINGRYPKEKWAVNRKSKELMHILSGSGVLVVEGKEYKLKQDDVVLIDTNERYYLDGKMRIGIPCTPAWTPDQHEEVEF